MDLLTLYKWTAIISGVAFIGQLLFGLVGLDHDLDFDSPGGDHDGAEMGHALLSFVSVRNVVCFLLAFSVTGYFCVASYGLGGLSVLPGAVAGAALVFFNMFLLRSLSRLKRDTSVRPEELAGQDALVSFTILGERKGQGKVDVNFSGRMMTLFAVTDDPEDIPRNSRVIIEQVMEGWIVLVRRKA